MSKRKGRKTTGGVTSHALQRMRQYWPNNPNSKETESEMKKLFQACKRVARREKSDRILIASRTLEEYGFGSQKFEKLGIPNGRLFAVLQGGEVINVMQIQQ